MYPRRNVRTTASATTVTGNRVVSQPSQPRKFVTLGGNPTLYLLRDGGGVTHGILVLRDDRNINIQAPTTDDDRLREANIIVTARKLLSEDDMLKVEGCVSLKTITTESRARISQPDIYQAINNDKISL